jgi:hypothetical protein
MRITPRPNKTGKIRPIVASFFTRRVRFNNSTKLTVSTQVSAAAITKKGEAKSSVKKNPDDPK